jgi:hypothetical protein
VDAGPLTRFCHNASCNLHTYRVRENVTEITVRNTNVWPYASIVMRREPYDIRAGDRRKRLWFCSHCLGVFRSIERHERELLKRSSPDQSGVHPA